MDGGIKPGVLTIGLLFFVGDETRFHAETEFLQLASQGFAVDEADGGAPSRVASTESFSMGFPSESTRIAAAALSVF